MIPNFLCLDPVNNIWRGGQPDDEGLSQLKASNIARIVRLNTEEGPDLTDPYFDLAYLPINLGEQITGVPPWVVGRAIQRLQWGNCFVHCEHGQDRTGLVCACFRVTACQWTKAGAEKEMLDLGFHKSLLGLWEFWEHYPDLETP